jgi:2-desacetyl-2-hydroxyethyl bacteriochlorophyllide A dehydrogenase
MKTMKALVIESPGVAVIRQVPIPKAASGEIVVQVKRTGICGTDLHIYKGEYISTYPIIPGHEFSGVVVEVGAGVESFQVGDRVSGDPNIYCGRCRFCLTNRFNHCESLKIIGVTLPGAMAEYFAIPADCVFHLPEPLTFTEGALIEPVSCVVQAMHRLSPRTGERALLLGAGAMGQQWVQALAHSGISELVVVDLSDEKLSLAREWGATSTIKGNEVEHALAGREGMNGFEIVIDTTGIASVIEKSLRYIGPSGKYVQFGVTEETAVVNLRPFDLFQREWTLIGSMAVNRAFEPALAWIQAGRLQTTHLVSRELTLEEALAYFEGDRRHEDLKVQISFE